jgi:outer membrane immunogenic protein
MVRFSHHCRCRNVTNGAAETESKQAQQQGLDTMKKILLATASLAALSGAAFAADLPSRKAAPVYAPPPPMWTGFYAGLNAGYNFGTNTNALASSWGPFNSAFNGTGFGAPIAGFLNNGVNGFLGPGIGAAGLAQSGGASMTQSGFIGGGQVGYNYQYGSNIVLGVEADIQGTGIRGSGYTGGAARSATFIDRLGPFGETQQTYDISANTVAVGGSAVQGGVDWMGTVRGRLGYLWTPTLLVYGTGGFAYGNVYGNVVSTASQTDGVNIAVINGNPVGGSFGAGATRTFVGGGTRNQINTGWTAGGGVEWMFMPNWSLKAEALYWDLGNMNVNTYSQASNIAGVSLSNAGPFSGSLGWGQAATAGNTRINYQGVTARAGVNYHFNWGAAPVVASY